jgi:hypothetical protein
MMWRTLPGHGRNEENSTKHDGTVPRRVSSLKVFLHSRLCLSEGNVFINDIDISALHVSGCLIGFIGLFVPAPFHKNNSVIAAGSLRVSLTKFGALP